MTSNETTKPDARVCLNIGGEKFKTLASTLSRIPDTRLSQLSSDDPAYDSENQEYFFDRNPRLFPYVLDAFRDGEIHFPRCVCAPALLSELRFWGLEDGRISACCWQACSDWADEKKMLALIDDTYGGTQPLNQPLETGSWKSRLYVIWLFLDDPHSSKMAKIWSFLYISLLVLSTCIISLETCEIMRVASSKDLSGIVSQSWNTSNPKISKYYHTEEHPVLRYANHLCSLFFFIELIVRFVSCPQKLRFFCSFFNIIDILAVIPMFIFSMISLSDPYFWISNNIEVAYNLVGLVAIFRAVRVLKLVKFNRGLQVIFLAIRASLNEIFLLGLLMTLCMIIFSTAVYFAELHEHDHFGDHPHFESIPSSFWWSIVTLTTVGYGDVIPATVMGRVIGGACALCGILMISLPVPVIANNFRLFHDYTSLKTKLDQRDLSKAVKEI